MITSLYLPVKPNEYDTDIVFTSNKERGLSGTLKRLQVCRLYPESNTERTFICFELTSVLGKKGYLSNTLTTLVLVQDCKGHTRV